jgi:hypothetical protein
MRRIDINPPLFNVRMGGDKEQADMANKSRIKVENLPQPAQELTPEEAKQVKGGLSDNGNGTGTIRNSSNLTTDRDASDKDPRQPIGF